MRIGRNPNRKLVREQRHTEVTLTTIVYIPFLTGYYEQAVEVLRLCLASMKQHAGTDCDLMVFDNGSCEEVRTFLLEEFEAGRIDYLLLSAENLGKAGAWNILFEAAPGEIIAFCDSDIYFKPGWLEPHVRIIKAFPNVGMVTGLPLRHQVDVFTKSGLERARQAAGVQVETGDFISEELMAAYCAGVNRDREEYRKAVAGVRDIRLTAAGESAYLGACHFQFVSPKASLKALLPLSARLLLDGSGVAQGSESELDQRIEAAGMLRLSTSQGWVHHMGNRLEPAYAAELERMLGRRVAVEPQGGGRAGAGLVRRLANVGLVRRVLMWAYRSIFRLYNTGTPKS